MKQDSVFWAIGALEDDLILEADIQRPVKKRHGGKAVRLALLAAAAAAMLTGGVVAAKLYTRAAERMEVSWNRQASEPMTGTQKDYIDEKSADTAESAADQGITILVDAVTCTGNTVYLDMAYAADPEQYSFEAMECTIGESRQYLENPSFETLEIGSGDCTGGSRLQAGGYQEQRCYSCGDTVEDGRLSDGNTLLRLEITALSLQLFGEDGSMQTQTVQGSWTLTIPLPESAYREAVTEAPDSEAGAAMALEIRQIAVTESGVQFQIARTGEAYRIIGADHEAAARYADAQTRLYTVEALLEDGSRIPTTGASMGRAPDAEEDTWSIQWLTPVDPDSVVSLIVSDGEMELEIPIH